MALNDNQKKFIELSVTGMKPTEMAKEIGVSRQMIYKYMNNEEIKSEVDRRIAEIKLQANKNLGTKINRYIDELEHIAFTSESEKIKSDALQYLIDRVLGKSTTKIESNASDKEVGSPVDLDGEMKDLDNVVDFEKVKAK